MRYKVMSLLDSTNNVDIYDPTTINWKDFKWQDGYIKHRLTKLDVLKFYMVPYRYYGNVEYEDIILLLNNVENSFDLVPETVIYLPKISELQTFLRDNNKS